MKTLAQVLMVLFFVIAYVCVLFSATIKFGLLNNDFIVRTFNKYNVYSNLANVVKSSIETQVNKGGGKIADISLVTDLITPENTSDFVNKNLFNLLNFVNGKSEQMEIYIPIDKVPKNIVPKSVADLNQSMTILDFGKRFNISGLENIPLTSLRKVGLYDYYLLMLSTTVSGILLIILFVMVQSGKRFMAPGFALILSGVLTVVFTKSFANINNMIAKNFTDSISINKIIILTIFPPLITEIIQIFIIIGLGLIVGGVIVLFIKKKLPI